MAFFLLWQAGLSLAGFLLYLGLPLVCWRVRSRWGRKTARVSWPQVRRWPGFAPYNRRWLRRGLLEAGIFGAPVGLAGAFLPYAYPTLEVAGIAAAALGALWFFALLGRRSHAAGEATKPRKAPGGSRVRTQKPGVTRESRVTPGTTPRPVKRPAATV